MNDPRNLDIRHELIRWGQSPQDETRLERLDEILGRCYHAPMKEFIEQTIVAREAFITRTADASLQLNISTCKRYREMPV